MIEFLIISTISLVVGYFFLRVGETRFALFPLAIILAFLLSILSGFSFKKISGTSMKRYGSIVSWGIVLAGVTLLFVNQGLARFQIVAIIALINTILYLGSFQRDYDDGKSVFSRGIIIALALGLGYSFSNHEYDAIPRILTIGSILFLSISIFASYTFTQLEEKDQHIIARLKEKSIYACCAMAIYWIFRSSPSAVLVSGITFATICIAIRQSFLTKKIEVKQDKKTGLSGRALLAGQKVLDWYDTQNESFNIHFFNFLITRGIMPSSGGMVVLQYSQIIIVIFLIIFSIWGLFHHSSGVLLRYRLGIISFLITLFGVHNQESFVKYYKTLAIVLITGSYYITLFDTTRDTASFTRGSMVWLMVNMVALLFYNDLFPRLAKILKKSDILLWLGMVILGGVVTTISLTVLPLNGSLLFAIGCIIIGIVGYFSYSIWSRIN